jgi:uncharacterized protein (DUF1810 family)
MSTSTPSRDPFGLERFVDAQCGVFEEALAEIRNGHKTTHWMWFIFPQLAGLGFSAVAQRYAIASLDEARAYLAHPLLGARLVECAHAALEVSGRSAGEIFGSPDDLKLCSSATLFAVVSPADSVFHQLLKKYYGGRADQKTLDLLALDRLP